MPKISFMEYFEMATDPDVSEDELMSFSKVVKGEGAFDFELKPDPDKVEMSQEDVELENALSIGNGLSRFRRQGEFRRRVRRGDDLPILVSEGDSWFQFPFLVKEVVDRLKDDYLIWSVGAAGDTAQNMVFGPARRRRTEYLKALDRQREGVKGFMFSAAGNDVIGEDPDTGRAVLLDLLKPFNGNVSDIEGHIDLPRFEETLDFLERAYSKVIQDVRADPDFERLPIFIHGYDYAFPFPWHDDPRDPIHASSNEWLGEPLDQRGILDKDQRRGIIKFLIDQLYVTLGKLAENPVQNQVWLVDCRGAMPDVEDWIDEIHGTSKGFKKVADRFRPVIAEALASQLTG